MFEPRLKIGGFGFSKSAAMDSMAKTAVGARGYMAPEVSPLSFHVGFRGYVLALSINIKL